MIGLDPGYDRVGYAVGTWEGNQLSLKTCGVIQTKKTDVIFDRYRQIQAQLNLVLTQFQPQVAHIESVFFSKNQKTAMQVSEARGIIIACLLDAQISIQEYSPQAVKLAATGYGNADKAAVYKMIKMQVKLPNHTNLVDDAVDAVALLLTK